MHTNYREQWTNCVASATCIVLPLAAVTSDYQFTTVASWYGPGFQGHKTASGQIYDQNKMTAANKTLPFGTRLIVKNLDTGRSCEVVINDRGPYVRGRGLDLSHAAARRIGMVGIAK
ncbi:MAG: septal ring lytic transglycosylase RlpA family protein, partial [Terriglobales bacterium]